MKLTHYIYYSAMLAMLTACGEDIEPVYTVGEADNAIVLSAGVADGMPKTQTRGATRAAGDPIYVAFTEGTKMALRIDGTWLGHTDANGDAYTEITQSSIGTINPENSSTDRDLDGADDSNTDTDTRGVSLSPQLYWDDYGTADPNNMPKLNESSVDINTGNGRAKGLTIYGVAVDGGTDDFNISLNGTDGTNWTNFQWIIGLDQKTDGWEKYDLLTSNNIREGSTSDGADGTFKFDNRNTTNPGNLLKFTHAMSKVTVNLFAGEGFTSGKFEATPSVTLQKFVIKGHVDIINKTTTPASDATAAITPKHASGDGGGTTPAKYEAIVYPGRTLTDSDELLELEADGNKYYVTTKALYNAITVADKTMKQGVNYVLNITVNKTAVHVEATIVDWVYVTGTDAPKINVNKVYGDKSPEAFEKSFSVLRSAGSINGTYLSAGDCANVNYSSPDYVMSPQLYWPTHFIHYYFRGVYPQIDKKDNSDQKLGPVIADFVHSEGKTCIKVANEAYRSGYYPSDLMIGMPRKADGTLDETCKVDNHKTGDTYPGGICATEGKINLNFRYVMSQVKVELLSSDPSSKDHVSFGENTEVIITGGYKEGQIQLSDGVADFTGKSTTVYSMTRKVTDPVTYTNYHDAIIPQTLLGGLSFKIKVKDQNVEGSYDYYEISVKDIEVQEQQAGTPGTWSDLHTIEAWEPGKIYTYKLTITKTGVKIIATITDWINVKGSTTIWM